MATSPGDSELDFKSPGTNACKAVWHPHAFPFTSLGLNDPGKEEAAARPSCTVSLSLAQPATKTFPVGLVVEPRGAW